MGTIINGRANLSVVDEFQVRRTTMLLARLKTKTRETSILLFFDEPSRGKLLVNGYDRFSLVLWILPLKEYCDLHIAQSNEYYTT